MSGDEGYKYQASLKYGAGQTGMLNVRANTKEEFVAAVTDALDSIGPLAVLTEAINTEFSAVSAVAAGFPGTQVVNQSQGQGGGEFCKHGAMVPKAGGSGKDAWRGFFCPAPKDDPTRDPKLCKPRYPNR